MLQLKASFKNRPTTGRKRSTGTLLGGGGGWLKVGGGRSGEAWLGPDRKLQGIVEMEGKQIFKNERLMKQVRIQNKSDCKMESCC